MRYFLLLLLPAALLTAARPNASAPAAPATTGTSFAQLDLAPLWTLVQDEPNDMVHNGFFGTDYRRLEMVFTSMSRDAKAPGLYHVRGKDRRFGKVRRFAGTVTFQALEAGEASSRNLPQPYSATGRFWLREGSSAADKNSGTFSGTVAVDFGRYPDGHLALYTRTTNPDTRGGGFLLRGTWANAGTGTTRAVQLKNGMAITYQVLPDFEIGDRSAEINPKYARVGWNSYWENTEWWAESPVAQR